MKNTVFYLAKRLFFFLLALLLLSILVFCMTKLSPMDPLRSYYGDSIQRMSQLQRENAMHKLGLDQPLWKQYFIWLSNVLQGDFGISFQYKQDSLQVIRQVLKNTLWLGVPSFFITFALALPLGIFSASHEDRLSDRILCRVGTVIGSIPSFWTSLLFILVFCVWLGVLPSSGAYDLSNPESLIGRLQHLILPSLVLILGHLWYYAYFVRNQMLEEFQKDYVLFFRAQGMSQWFIYRSCFRSILPSYLSMMAISVPHIISGTYLVEMVFSYPGLGKLCFESAKYQDYNLLALLCLITGTAVILSSMLAQGISQKLNRRLQFQSEQGES